MHTTIPYASEPRTFVIDLDTKILNQMKMIDEWRGYMKALADLQHVFPEVARENAFQEALSNVRLEGATIDTERARTMLANGDAPRDQAESEFLNYHRLLESMDSFAGSPGKAKEQFRESDIRQFHAEIVRDALADTRAAGNYRTEEVKVAKRHADGREEILHEAPAPLEVPALMNSFVGWLNTVNARGEERLNGLITAALAHYEFVRIHPFVDGNGRTARFLASVILLQHGYDFRNLFCITEYYNAQREKYSAALHSVDAPAVRHRVDLASDGRPEIRTETVFDATRWVRYFLGGLALQMKACEARVGHLLDPGRRLHLDNPLDAA